MTLRHGNIGSARQVAEDRDARIALDGLLENPVVVGASKRVQKHSGDRDAPVELRETEDERRGAPRHRAAVDHKEHRGFEHLRQVCGASPLVARARAVEESHHPFDDREVRAGGVAVEQLQRAVAREQHRVEVPAGPP